jgi:hypothetical protein
MAFNDFPSNLFVTVAQTSEELQLGGFTVDQAIDLKHVVLTMYKHGAAAGSERFKIKIYGSPTYSGSAMATSDWVTLASFSTSTYWIGRVRFDFSSQVPLGPTNKVYLSLAHENYTENLTTFYVGCPLDWPIALNTQATTGLASAIVALVGYE